jgi:hypothetical protein
MQVLKNKKTFLFRNKFGSLFIVAFVRDFDGKTKVKSVGARAFHYCGFIDCFSVNSTTDWLGWQGNTYVKRLPVRAGTDYNEREMVDTLKSIYHVSRLKI